MDEQERRETKRNRRWMGGKGYYIALFAGALALAIAGYLSVIPKEDTVKRDKDIAQQPLDEVPQIREKEDKKVSGAAELYVEEEDEEKPEPTVVVSPISGETVAAFSGEALEYSETFADWRTHDGIDIAADIGTQVFAAASGTVLSVSDDDLMGVSVVVEHGGGYETTYANMQDCADVAVGDYVTTGQVIGTVGESAMAEANLAPHLHFAVTKDGHYIDPSKFLEQ